jgi:hypothetical protein
MVCHAFFPWRTTNFFVVGWYPCLQPLACALPLRCARTRRAAKTFPLPCAVGKCTANIYLPCVFLWHTTSIYVRREFPSGSRQSIYYKKLVFVLLLFLHYKNISLYSIFQFYTCLDKSTILTIMCHLKNFCLIHRILIASV